MDIPTDMEKSNRCACAKLDQGDIYMENNKHVNSIGLQTYLLVINWLCNSLPPNFENSPLLDK